MECHPVLLAAFLLISCTGMVYPGAAPSDSRVKFCAMYRYGKLTQFVQNNDVGNNVELPCMFVLADFRKGDYRVIVWARNSLDEEDIHRFSPDWVKVRVKNTNTGHVWVATTKSARLRREDVDDDNVWNVDSTCTLTPDRVDLTPDGSAMVKVNRLFKLTFARANQDYRGIEIEVYGSVRSKAYPESLCGSTEYGVDFRERQNTLFGDHQISNRSMVFTYDVLNDPSVQQSRTCDDIQQTFQGCDEAKKDDAILICSPIYSSRPLSRCLMDPNDPQEHFDNCLRAVCDDDASSCQAVNNACCGSDSVDCYSAQGAGGGNAP